MRIGTALFSYNRSWCTKQSLEALHRCRVLPERLFLFHDGIKDEKDKNEWEKIEEIIHTIDWCKTEVITSKENKGLARSISEGVSYMFESCDAVIVVEDDCIVHPQFMEYMINALEFYVNKENVFSVSGYCEPIRIEKDEYDSYFTGRISSLGWGTWKNRWDGFELDYKLFSRIKKDKELSERLSIWGQDLETTVIANLSGNADSWAVFWALKSIITGGGNLAPFKSLVDNIGFDGSGIHSGDKKPEYILQERDEYIDLNFPPDVMFREDVINKMKDYYSFTPAVEKERYYRHILFLMYSALRNGLSLSDVLRNRGISSISLWGKGQISTSVIDELKGSIEVRNILVSKQLNHYEEVMGIPVIGLDSYSVNVDAILVIPGYDIDRIKRKCICHNISVNLITIDDLYS